ncbi:MAG: hypothetical protein LBD27_00740 [Tannerella sp.]|jgi:hypothetical protein|nr:hypothetical protein [Tannerella sp.]
MSTRRDYLPLTYAALLNWLLNFLGYVMENLNRFNIPISETETLQETVNAFQVAQAKAENPNAGKADRLERKETANAVRKAVRDFVNVHLRYNRAVTDEDRVKMGLHVPDTTPTPVGEPTTMPVVEIDTSIIMRLTLKYRNAGSSSRAKPAGTHGVEIRWEILPVPPDTTADLTHSEFSTRSPHTFVFEENQRGKTVYFRLRWENMRGQKGPWSEIYSTVIP